MNVVSSVAGTVLPVFALIALGAAFRAARLLDAGGLRGLTDLTFLVGIPVLLFGALVDGRPPGDGVRVAVLFMAAVLAVFALGVAIATFVLRARLSTATLMGMNGCYGNTALLGLPLVDAAFGAPGLAVLLPVIAVHSLVLVPLASVMIELEDATRADLAGSLRRTVGGVLRNPVIVALLAAAAWRWLGVPVPVPLHRLLSLLGGMGAPLALISLGATLPDFAHEGSVRETGLTAVLKLLVLPSLVWALCAAFRVPPFETAVVVTTAGAPTGATAFFLARRVGTQTAAAAGTVVVTTVVSVLTLSVIIGVLRP